MRITKHITVETEVEIDLCSEDVALLLSEVSGGGPESAFEVLRGVNTCGGFLKAISDDQIAAMHPGQRTTISNFLSQQATRFAP